MVWASCCGPREGFWGSVQKSWKKSASLLWKNIIRDQRALRRLQRNLNVRASERSE